MFRDRRHRHHEEFETSNAEPEFTSPLLSDDHRVEGERTAPQLSESAVVGFAPPTTVPLDGLEIPQELTLDASAPESPVRPVAEPWTRGRVYGSETTFDAEPWWGPKGWWKVARDGEANDIRTHVGTVGQLALAATSLRGHKHRLNGVVNEDSYATTTVHLEDGRQFLIIALCDGMGSAKYASYGARMAAHTAAAALRQFVETWPNDYEVNLRQPENQRKALDWITRRVVSYSTADFDAPDRPNSEVEVGEMQCTLTFAIAPAQFETESANCYRVVLGFVGDSPAFFLREGDWVAIEPAKNTDGIWSSAADGLLGATELLVTAIDVFSGEGLLITSDGVGNFLKFNGVSTALGEDLAQRWAAPLGMLDFVQDVAFETVSADDDRTAVVVWFRGDRS